MHSNMRVVELLNRFGMMVAEDGCREIGKRMTYYDSPKKQWLALYLWQHVKHKCPNLREAFFVREVDVLVDRLACMQPKNVEQSKVKAFAQIVRSGAPPKELPASQSPYGYGGAPTAGGQFGGQGSSSYAERSGGYYGGDQRQLGYARAAPDGPGQDYLEGPSRSTSFPSYARQQEKEKILKDMRACIDAAYDHSALLQEIMDAEVEEEVTEETLEELLESCEQILTDVNDLADKAANFSSTDLERSLGELLAAGDELSEAFGDFQEFLKEQILNEEPAPQAAPQLQYEVEEDDRLPAPKPKKSSAPKKTKPGKESLAIEAPKKKKSQKALAPLQEKLPTKGNGKEAAALPPPAPEPIKPLPPGSQKGRNQGKKAPELPPPPVKQSAPGDELADLLGFDGPVPPMQQDQSAGEYLAGGVAALTVGSQGATSGGPNQDAFGEQPFGSSSNQMVHDQNMYGGYPGGPQGQQQMGASYPSLPPGHERNFPQLPYGSNQPGQANAPLALPAGQGFQQQQQPPNHFHGAGRMAAPQQSQYGQQGVGMGDPSQSTDIVLANTRQSAGGSQALVPSQEAAKHKKNNPFASGTAGAASPPPKPTESDADPFGSLHTDLPNPSNSAGAPGVSAQFSASMGPPKSSYYTGPPAYGMQSPPSVGTPIHRGSPMPPQYQGMGGNASGMGGPPVGMQSQAMPQGQGMGPGNFTSMAGQQQAPWGGVAQMGNNMPPNPGMPPNRGMQQPYPGSQGMGGGYSGRG